MKHHRDSVGLGRTVDDFQFFYAVQIIIGEEKLMGRVDLDHANVKAQDLLDIGENILALSGMQAATRDQTFRIFLDVIGDPLIDGIAETDDFRRNVVDEHATIDAHNIHVLEKCLGRAAVLGDLFEILPLAPHQLHGVRAEHLDRSDMDVAVGDQVNGQRRADSGNRPGLFNSQRTE